MADKITQSTYLDVNMGFADDDTRRFKVPNPVNDADAIRTAVGNFDSAVGSGADSFFVGDKAGAAYIGVLTVDSVAAQKVTFDI